jgi:UDP-glucose 4-epimerase
VRVLVTGAAGFIGSNVADALIARGDEVRGVDSFLDYYPRAVKERNLAGLRAARGFEFHEQDLVSADLAALTDGCDAVLHLAAQAGVRASWGKDFRIYCDANILATQRLLEACAARKLRVVYSSSSSIYGDAPDFPTRETTLPRPISP